MSKASAICAATGTSDGEPAMDACSSSRSSKPNASCTIARRQSRSGSTRHERGHTEQLQSDQMPVGTSLGKLEIPVANQLGPFGDIGRRYLLHFLGRAGSHLHADVFKFATDVWHSHGCLQIVFNLSQCCSRRVRGSEHTALTSTTPPRSPRQFNISFRGKNLGFWIRSAECSTSGPLHLLDLGDDDRWRAQEFREALFRRLARHRRDLDVRLRRTFEKVLVGKRRHE